MGTRFRVVAGLLVAAQAWPAVAEPMSSAEFEQRYQTLQIETVRACLDPAVTEARGNEARLDACLDAHEWTRASAQEQRNRPPAIRGVYWALDSSVLQTLAQTIIAIDGKGTLRFCLTIKEQIDSILEIDRSQYAEPTRSQLQARWDAMTQPDHYCAGTFPEDY